MALTASVCSGYARLHFCTGHSWYSSTLAALAPAYGFHTLSLAVISTILQLQALLLANLLALGRSLFLPPLEGVPDLHGAPQDEASLTRKLEM